MTVPKPIFDVIVFSGGGFKGAYGAGAAKAIMEYYKNRDIQRSLCFVGNSAGALNAAVLAASSVDDLIRFWLSVSREQVLGLANPSFWGLGWLYIRRTFSRNKNFFSVYPGEPRRNLIQSAVSFGSIRDRDQHLIIAATDFIYAEARAFFSSQLMARMKQVDDQKDFHDRRLMHCSPIQSQEELVLALLGSTAIPLAFPPVEIEYFREDQRVKSFFVDGGIGNNVPTREAAYFLRNLEDLGLGQAGDTYCIKLSPARVVADRLEHDPASILLRTYDVYDYIHMERIVAGWHRINREIDRWNDPLTPFEAYLNREKIQDPAWRGRLVAEIRNLTDRRNELLTPLEDLLNREIQDPALRERLLAEVRRLFGLRQHRLNLIEIEPTNPLGGTLDFSRDQIRCNIKMGHDDALTVLEKCTKITHLERSTLINNFRLSENP